ncbi:DUF6153 family protein [Streptomyces sp900116325]|uniref:DUF6153 family protein n=1 Tax=Streptomyces sp. 900116325 TaxID=3154295 RepID=UPI0033A23313
MSRHVRTRGALGHLLLVVVLALGVFMMHTMGHPNSSSGMSMEAAPHAPATVAHPGDSMTSSQAVSASTGALDNNIKASAHAPGMGMDMTSLCVAVLGTWMLAGLLRAALSARTDWLARLRDGALGSLRPNPPPCRPPDLAQLSVLRI